VEVKLTTSQLKSVQEYCKLNNIEDVDKFISKCFTNGLNIEKYGLLEDDLGKTGIVSEKQVEIEVIREIRVEIPVEVVKYVEIPVEIIKEIEVIQYVDREVIKEVPVEIIKEKVLNVIQEVPVPNIDKIRDKTKINELLLKIQQLENQEPIIKEVVIEKIVEVEKPNDKTLLLQETLQTLKKELSLKNSRIEELEEKNKLLESNKISQGAVYLKGSNLNEMM
jgi:hypothetical protein